LTNEQLEELSGKIAYITINPRGNFLKSAQIGFRDVGLQPQHLIYVKPIDRLKKEFKRYKLSFLKEFLFPKFKKFLGNKKAFSQEEVNIPIPNTISVAKLNSLETIAQIKKLGIKYLINCGAGIFRKQLIEIPGLVILNAHAGRLPMFKNMNVVEWAICNEEKVFGTIHQIDAGIDSGPVWLEEEIDVTGKKTLVEAREYAFDHVIRMAGRALVLNEQGKITPQYHDPNEGKKWYKMHSYYQNRVEQLLNKK
jgi:folate-dependent phosphoribosylglycinamide formyltransferase PurN